MEEKQEGTEAVRPSPYKNLYVILNPVAGHSSADHLRQILEEHCKTAGIQYEIYETSGEEDVSEVTRNAVKAGADLVIAAGGDGTVAGVVNGLIHHSSPLGIIPVGTGNGLARALSVPLEPVEALQVILGKHTLRAIDAMQVGDQYYILNVSAGISSRAMRSTDAEKKRKYGILAYVWTILQQVIGYEPRRYNLEMDGHQVQVRAAEILISNGALLTEPPNPLGPPETFNDQRLDVYMVTAQSLTDYLRLLWGLRKGPREAKSELRTFSVKQKVRIDAVRRPQPVQADGELIGKTPVEVQLVPDAIRVITPPLDSASRA